MIKEKILIIEDDKHIAKLVKYNLEKAGFDCMVTITGEEALTFLDKRVVDLIVLDIMLPGMDGFSVCRQIKKNEETSHIPIIMLTAKGEETDIVLGLELGADDYITKPFKVRELLARIKAVLRRTKNNISPLSKEKDIIKFKDLVIDSTKHQVTLKDQPLNLTSTEFKLLKFLASHPGKVFTREQLLNQVWAEDSFIVDRAVDVHIRRLRQKLLTYSDYIITIRGVGYRFKEEV